MAALAFAPSAQAAGSYNVMLTKVPAGVRSVDLWDHTEDISVEVGCITVQPGRDKNTGYKISSGHYLVGEMYSRTECSGSHKGSTTSATVSNNLGTANFWFALN